MKCSRKIVFVVVPICLVIGALFILSNWGNGPSEGTIQTGKPTAKTTPAEQAVPLRLDNNLFTTTLPLGFVSKNASQPTTEVPVRLLATNPATRQQVGISGGDLPHEGITGLADYNLRVKDTANYQRTTGTAFSSGGVAFQDTAGSMLTLFWPHGGTYVSITVSGNPGSLSDLNNTLLEILQNWQWK